MLLGWATISSKWDVETIQAALNVFLSVLATFGIWSVSRFWWQKGSEKLLRGKIGVPLPTVCVISSPSEGWELCSLLKSKVFSRETWCLLLQFVIIITLTLVSTFAGPISKNSLRSTRGLSHKRIEVLQTTKGGGYSGNLLLANVLWNDTIFSLDQANFPKNQLLDYLPTSTAAWIYNAEEWDPTWTMTCKSTPETVLHNVIASGNYTFYDPVNAFPAFRDTFDRSWLNSSLYRMQANFNSWQKVEDPVPFKEAMFFVLFQSDPEIKGRMYTNKETLQLCISALHVREFKATNFVNTGEAATTEWKPTGPVQSASFTRVECNITRKTEVADEDAIPWIWTNDTFAIMQAYSQYSTYTLEAAGSKNLSVSTPTPEDLLRFYQVYMASVNTIRSFPSFKIVSVWVDTVQASVALLAILAILTSSAIWLALRYYLFLSKFRPALKEVFIPDGKIEWMARWAKLSRIDTRTDKDIISDGDHFCGATFGHENQRTRILINSCPNCSGCPLTRAYFRDYSISPHGIQDSQNSESPLHEISRFSKLSSDDSELKKTLSNHPQPSAGTTEISETEATKHTERPKTTQLLISPSTTPSTLSE